jgi:hypothetical protein
MSQKTAFTQLREQAIALRRAGKSRREIKELLAITSNRTLDEALRGEPPQPWTWRPNAKDDLRAKARDLREQGLDYEEIVAELGVSKSSVSLWVRDLPRPPGLSYEECRKRAAEGVRRYWAAEGPIREAQRQAISAAATAQIGQLNDREILVAGAIAYWCEGAKNKPHRRDDRVCFMNTDPMLIRFFLRFSRPPASSARASFTGCRSTRSPMSKPPSGSGSTSRRPTPVSSGVRRSSGITPGPFGRTRAMATTAACASTSGGAAACTGRSRAGLRPPCPQ